MPNAELEADDIRAALAGLTRSTWHGELALLELSAAGVRDIDPARWPATYFAFLGSRLLRRISGSDGPTIAGHHFPYRDGYVWELTAAEVGGIPELDLAAARVAIREDRGFGVAVAHGQSTGDDEAFARWLRVFHRDPDGGATIASDPHTPVPVEFRPTKLGTLFFHDDAGLDRALREGAIAAAELPGRGR